LIDVNTLPDEKLRQQRWIGPLSLAMKHIREKDFSTTLETILTCIDWPLEDSATVALLQQFLLYLYTSANIQDANAFLEICYERVSEPVRKTLMTIAEQIELAGIEKGIEKGILKTAENMLELGSDVQFICKVTGLSAEEVNQLANRQAMKR
jgi:predicted transposase/invertase (TIGR01784 family)